MSDPAIFDLLADDQDNEFMQPANELALQAALKSHPDARLIAGGTDLMLEVTQLYRTMPELIDVTRVLELRQINEGATHYVIGAAVPYTELEEFFKELSPPLLKLLLRFGSRQIRNRGTVGGNLANGSPIADIPPVLIALDAHLELVNPDGVSRSVDVADFYTAYHETVLGRQEYLARIHIPKSSLQSFHRIYKASKRIEDDISSVLGAFRFTGDKHELSEVRIAFGGMAATPVRLKVTEQLLLSGPVNDALIERATASLDKAMTPLTDVRASAHYRSAMARSMLERALREYLGRTIPVVSELQLHE